MKYFQLVLVFFLFFTESHSQTETNIYGKIEVEIRKENRKKIYSKVEIKSAFPGGDSSWVQFIEKELSVSSQLGRGAKKGKYLVSISFIINKEGKMCNVLALTRNGYSMEAEVVRAIKKNKMWLRPFWSADKTIKDLIY